MGQGRFILPNLDGLIYFFEGRKEKLRKLSYDLRHY